MKDKPNIWVKSYPYPKEVLALTDLGKQDIGMEIFLGGDKERDEECLRICQDNYQRVGVELFVYQNGHKGKGELIYDPLSDNKHIRQLSQGYLFNALALADKYGAKHLQLDANDGYKGRPGQDINLRKREFITKKKEFLSEISNLGYKTPIFFENTFPIDDHMPELVFSCIGHNLSDFGEGKLPLEYDVAHHAIALDVYSRANQFNFPLTEQEKELVEKVKKQGMTAVIQEQLQNFPGQIYFTHLGNATPFALQTKSDVMYEGSEDDLFDLETVLPILMEKSLNITPEVGDDDFTARPNLRRWIKKLQAF